MVFLFSCRCETDAPTEFRFITLTCDMSSTGGTENWGTFTETLPWATQSFRKLSWWRSLKQQEKITRDWSVQYVQEYIRRDCYSTWHTAFFINVNSELGGILCATNWVRLQSQGGAPRYCFYQFWEQSQGLLCWEGAEWGHGWGGFRLTGLRLYCPPAEW